MRANISTAKTPILFLLSWICMGIFSHQAMAEPGVSATCTVTAFNRTAPLEADYSFTLFNLPSSISVATPEGVALLPFPPFRARVICSDGTVGETEMAFPQVGQSLVFTGPIFWREATPIPLALSISSSGEIINSGSPAQLSTTGIYAIGSTSDLTQRSQGTLYVTNNPLLASLTQDGLVSTSVSLAQSASAKLLIAAQNEGVTATKVLEIGYQGRIVGTVTRHDGSPLAGARVSVLRNQPRETVATIYTDAVGAYSVESVGAGGFLVLVADEVTGDAGSAVGQIVQQGETSRIDVRMNGVGTANITVQSEAGPISGAAVTFSSLSAFSYTKQQVTGATGGLAFSPVPAGDFSAIARDPVTGRVGAAVGKVTPGGTTPITIQLQAVASISGRVLAADGVSPVAGTQVRLVSSVRGLLTQTVTGQDGQYLFDSLPVLDGTYGLDAMLDGRLRARINGIALTTQGQEVVRDLVFGPVGLVQGVVKRADGSAAVGATVRLQSQAGVQPSFDTRADSSGNYRIDGVPVGAFVVSAAGANNENTVVSGAIVSDGAEVTLNLQMAASGLVGTVYQRDGVTPVGLGVVVKLSPGNLMTTTNANGRYGFSVSTANSYTVDATDDLGNKGRTTVVLTTIDPAHPTNADVTFLGRGSVAGQVLDATNVVQPNATVTLVNKGIFAGSLTTTTDAQGQYQFPDVFVGSYSVTAKNAQNFVGSSNGTLVSDGEAVTTDVVLAAAATLTGRILRVDGVTPVANAEVQASVAGTALPIVITDAQGNYSMLVPLGDVTLTAVDKFTGDKGRAYTTLATVGETRLLTVNMVGVGTVNVKVRNPSGNPVSGATVMLDNNGLFPGSVQLVTPSSGDVTFTKVTSGSFSVRVSKSENTTTLTGNGSGTVHDGETVQLTVTTSASITGRVQGLVQLGATPMSGVTMQLLQIGASGVFASKLTDANGLYGFDNVPGGNTFLLRAMIDSRVRGFSSGISVTTQDEVVSRDISLIGLGSVAGRILNEASQTVAGIRVTLRNPDPIYGGTFSTTSDVAGNYAFANIPAGTFSLTATDTVGGRLAEGAGAIGFHGDAQTVDLTLVSNAVTLPRTLYDANAAKFVVGQHGALADGTNGAFIGNGSVDTSVNNLDVIVSGVPVPFQNDSGSLGKLTKSGRQLEVRGVHEASGLTVTRRTYVPKSGYFARHVDLFENTTANPVTVGVRVTSNISAGSGGSRIVDSSNNDTILSSNDRWVVIDDNEDTNVLLTPSNKIPPVILVFADTNGALLPNTASTTIVGTTTKATLTWSNVTVAPGTTFGLMYLTSQQVDRVAARATADRLAQLPPEVLESLGADEIAAVRNMALPVDGVSALPPLPAVDVGKVSGTLYSGDGATPVYPATVSFRSQSPYYGHVWSAATDSSGKFLLETLNLGTEYARVMPRGPFVLNGKYEGRSTASTAGNFAEGALTAQQDVLFENTFTLKGVVTRHTGTLVPTGEVYVYGPVGNNVDIVNGSYTEVALPPGTYQLTAKQPHPQGSYIQGEASVTAQSGVVVTQNVVMEETGEIVGSLVDEAGTPIVNAVVTIQNYRSTRTDTGGNFRLSDVRVGQHVVVAQDSTTGRTTSDTVSVASDLTSNMQLQFVSTTTVVAQVNFARGAPAAGVSLRMSFDARIEQVITNGAGQASFTVPVGKAITFKATHPDNSDLYTEITTTAQAQTTTTVVTLPATASISGTVVKVDGVTPASGLQVRVRKVGDVLPAATKTTSATGAYNIKGLSLATYLVYVEDLANAKYAEATATLTTDGDQIVANLRLADNIVALPTKLYDANSFAHNVQQNGSMIVKVFESLTFNRTFNPAAALKVNGTAFGGNTSAFLSGDRRQLTIGQAATISGLNVSRKVYTPRDGYFTRYLEILENPGTTPVTASVRVTDSVSQNIRATSSGDTTLQAANDNWYIVDDSEDSDPFFNDARYAPVAHVYGQPGAADRIDALTFSSSTVEAGWDSVVVPAGGRVVLMHFVLEQVSMAGANAAATRLAQLPPEALQHLAPEDVLSIVNFTIPPNAVSALEALPVLTGQITGRALEGDQQTAVSGMRVQFRSQHPLFGRTHALCANASTSVLTATNGAYTITGRIADSGSIPVPVSVPVDVQANAACTSSKGHPTTGIPSPVVAAAFVGGATTTTADIVFPTGIITGLVQGTTDYGVSGSEVRISIPSGKGTVIIPASNVGAYTIRGVPAATYTLNSTIPHNQGTSLEGSFSGAALNVGQTLIVNIPAEPAGSVAGMVLAPNGTPATGIGVSISGTVNGRSVSRSMSTDSQGRYLLTAVPAGTYTITAYISQTGFEVRSTIVVLADQQCVHNITLPETGKVQLTVKYPRNVAAGNAVVKLVSAALPEGERAVGSTNSFSGTLDIGVPRGAYTLKVSYPSKSHIAPTEYSGVIVTNYEVQSATVTLPAVTSALVTVVDADAGNAAIYQARVRYTDRYRNDQPVSGTTNTSGRITVSELVEGPFSITAIAPNGRRATYYGTVMPSNDGVQMQPTVSVTGQNDRQGEFTFGTEQLLYSIPVNSGDRVSVWINGAPFGAKAAAYAAKAQVFNAGNTVVASGYGYDQSNSYLQYNTQGNLLNVEATEAGNYTVAVAPYYDNDKGGYRLGVHVNSQPVYPSSYLDGGLVQGTVFRSDGTTPAANRIVEISTQGQLALRTRVTTDAAGHYVFSGVPVGDLTVSVIDTQTNYVAVTAAGHLEMAAGTAVVDLVIPSETTLSISVTVPEPQTIPSYVPLSLTDGRGKRTVTNATFPTGSRTSNTVTTTGYGSAISVTARHPTNALLSVTQSVTPADGQTVPVNISLVAGQLSGYVRSAAGGIVRDALISVYEVGTNTYLTSTYSDTNGYFLLPALPIGRDLIVVFEDPQSGAVTEQSVQLSSGQMLVVDLQASSNVGTVMGTVTASDGRAIGGAQVSFEYVLPLSGKHQVTTRATDSSGLYRVDGIPVGIAVALTATKTTVFASVSASDTATIATAGDTATVNFVLNIAGSSVLVDVLAADGSSPTGNCTFSLTQGTTVVTSSALCSTRAQFEGVPAGDVTVSVSSSLFGAMGSAVLTVPDSGQTGTTFRVTKVSGVVLHSDGVPAQTPSITISRIVDSPDEPPPPPGEPLPPPSSPTSYTVWNGYGQTNGVYEVFALASGEYQVQAQDTVSGLSSLTGFTVVGVDGVVTADVNLPVSGTVTGLVVSSTGAPVANADVYVRSTGLNLDRYVRTGTDGRFTVVHMALGDISVRARDPLTKLITFAQGVLGSVNQTITVNLPAPQVGALTGRVLNTDGVTPMSGITVTAKTVNTYGAFGAQTYTVVSDAAGNYQFAELPIGEMSLSVASGSLRGSATATISVGATVTVDVVMGTAVTLPFILNGTDSGRYDVACTGALTDGGFGGVFDAYDTAYRLTADNVSFPCLSVAGRSTDGRELTFGPQTMTVGRVTATREVYVPTAGGFARYVDTIKNDSSTTLSVPVTVAGNLGSDGATRIVVAPSATGNRYAVTADLGTDPALAHVFAGTGGSTPTTMQFIPNLDNISYGWTLSIPPGESRSIVHFAVQRARGDTTGAQAQAEALANLSQSGMFDGMTSQERARVINFPVSP